VRASFVSISSVALTLKLRVRVFNIVTLADNQILTEILTDRQKIEIHPRISHEEQFCGVGKQKQTCTFSRQLPRNSRPQRGGVLSSELEANIFIADKWYYVTPLSIEGSSEIERLWQHERKNNVHCLKWPLLRLVLWRLFRWDKPNF